jgi:hypothetical protein
VVISWKSSTVLWKRFQNKGRNILLLEEDSITILMYELRVFVHLQEQTWHEMMIPVHNVSNRWSK